MQSRVNVTLSKSAFVFQGRIFPQVCEGFDTRCKRHYFELGLETQEQVLPVSDRQTSNGIIHETERALSRFHRRGRLRVYSKYASMPVFIKSMVNAGLLT